MWSVVVSGALANRPRNSGGASVRMTWVVGLRRLGFDVWFVEQIDSRLLRGDNSGGNTLGPGEADRSPHVEFFRETTARFGLTGRSALLDEHGQVLEGVSIAELRSAAAAAELLVNLGGHLRLPLRESFRRKAYVDLDPGYTQFWNADGLAAEGLESHDCFFTVGLGVGSPGCTVPTNGIRWRPLPPPVVLDEWPAATNGSLETFTTIASWRGAFGRVEHDGRLYGLKAHEFRKVLDLPAHAPVRLEIALAIHRGDATDLEALRAHGWIVVDPLEVVPDVDSYSGYIRRSGAELSVAQGIYVETASGWLSDRTVRYLASGRPALVQDTGISRHLPVGEGLLVFRSLEEAAAGAHAIARDYDAHRRRARELAAACFDSDVVLRTFLEHAEASP